MKAMKRNSKAVTFVLLLALMIATSFPAPVFAADGVISGDSEVNNVTINVILPSNLNFALDPLSLDVDGENQISKQDFIFVNQTLAPVKVAIAITATATNDTVLISSTGALAKMIPQLLIRICISERLAQPDSPAPRLKLLVMQLPLLLLPMLSLHTTPSVTFTAVTILQLRITQPYRPYHLRWFLLHRTATEPPVLRLSHSRWAKRLNQLPLESFRRWRTTTPVLPHSSSMQN